MENVNHNVIVQRDSTSQANQKGRKKQMRYVWAVFVVLLGVTIIALERWEPFFSFGLVLYSLLLLFLIVRWIVEQRKTILHLRQQNMQTELQQLQSQVNPHFLFNTLNNLYGWIDKDVSQAKQMVLTLSDLMRHSVYVAQKDWVSLEDEWAFIERYVELQSSRYQRNVDIELGQQIEGAEIMVRPLLFIILIENAFKHGVEALGNNAWLKVNLQANKQMIKITIQNNFDLEHSSANPGIGLQNLTRRLELLYPQKHLFIAETRGDVYKAELKLDNG